MAARMGAKLRAVLLTTGQELAAGGDAVARAPDGRVVFVEGAAPGEVVEAEIVRSNARFLRARVTAVRERSPVRVDPPCPHYGRCGGCTLQHVAAAAQTASKQAAMLETIRRIGRLDLGTVTVAEPWCGPSYGYRSRARLAVGRRREVGFRAAASRDVVDVAVCAILTPPLQGALEEVRRRAAAGDALPPEVEAVANDREARIGLAGRIAEPLAAEDGAGPLLLAPGVFAQSNRAGNQAMCAHLERRLAARAPARVAIELYSGSGNFTRVVAARAAQVRAFEADRGAHELAARVRPPNVELACRSAEDALAELTSAGAGAGVDVLVVDPPRTGLSAAAADGVGALGPHLALYISCDVPTFARDAARLARHGLALAHLRLFDLYPQTAHAELIGEFRRTLV